MQININDKFHLSRLACTCVASFNGASHFNGYPTFVGLKNCPMNLARPAKGNR